MFPEASIPNDEILESLYSFTDCLKFNGTSINTSVGVPVEAATSALTPVPPTALSAPREATVYPIGNVTLTLRVPVLASSLVTVNDSIANVAAGQPAGSAPAAGVFPAAVVVVNSAGSSIIV